MTKKLSGSASRLAPWRRSRRAIPFDARPASAAEMSAAASNAAALVSIRSSASNQSRSPGPSASASRERSEPGFSAAVTAPLPRALVTHAVRVRGAADHHEIGALYERGDRLVDRNDNGFALRLQALGYRVRNQVRIAVHRLVYDDRLHRDLLHVVSPSDDTSRAPDAGRAKSPCNHVRVNTNGLADEIDREFAAGKS